MIEWKTYRYTEIADLIGGGTPKTSEPLYWDGDIPWLSVKDFVGDSKYVFSTEKHITKLGLENSSTKLLQKDDIIISARGTVGEMAMIPFPMSFNQSCFGIRANGDLVDPHFLYYYTKTKVNELKGNSHGSVFDTITRATFDNIICLLPPLEEQRRIAGILGAIDDKIENNRRINTNLELQAQALYKQWFVDFEFPNEEGKPYKSSGGKMVDSELGQIPEGWSVGKLEDIGDIIGGGTPSKAVAEYYTKNGIAWITPKDLSVSHSKFTSKGETDITELGYKNSSAKIIPRGSVLFSSRAPIGYISIAKNDICTNQGFKSVVPNNGCTAFVYYFLLSNTENIESKATGSTFKEASGALMKSLELVIPSEDILEKFEKIMSPIFELQEKFEAENETLTTLRDTLLPKLMNGEIKL